MTRRSEVQRWPAVPAAENTMPRTVRSRSARRRDDRRVVAAELEQQPAEAAGDARRDRPAHPGRAGRAEQRDARVVDERLADRRRRRARADETAAGAPTRRAASATSAWQASAVSSVFSDGFHTTGSPQTKASAAFHDQTATGKLNALMTPTTPSGCHCSIIRWPGPLGGDGQAEQLAGQADREVADVDHLLDLAEALGADLAGLDRDERAEIGLVLAQQLAELADQLAADRGRHRAPGGERLGALPTIVPGPGPAVCAGPGASSPPVMGERATSVAGRSVAPTPRRARMSLVSAIRSS